MGRTEILVPLVVAIGALFGALRTYYLYRCKLIDKGNQAMSRIEDRREEAEKLKAENTQLHLDRFDATAKLLIAKGDAVEQSVDRLTKRVTLLEDLMAKINNHFARKPKPSETELKKVGAQATLVRNKNGG